MDGKAYVRNPRFRAPMDAPASPGHASFAVSCWRARGKRPGTGPGAIKPR